MALAGAAGFEPANAGTKNRRQPSEGRRSLRLINALAYRLGCATKIGTQIVTQADAAEVVLDTDRVRRADRRLARRITASVQPLVRNRRAILHLPICGVSSPLQAQQGEMRPKRAATPVVSSLSLWNVHSPQRA